MRDMPFKITDKELVAKNWGSLWNYDITLQHSDGIWRPQRREIYERGHAVACLLHDPAADTVLMIRQFRMPVALVDGDGAMIEAPAGSIEEEDPEAAMRRELLEETGYEATRLTHCFDLFSSPGTMTEKVSFYLGTYEQANQVEAGGGLEEEDEDIEVLHLPVDEALSMIKTGGIKNALAVILLQQLALKLGRSF